MLIVKNYDLWYQIILNWHGVLNTTFKDYLISVRFQTFLRISLCTSKFENVQKDIVKYTPLKIMVRILI